VAITGGLVTAVLLLAWTRGQEDLRPVLLAAADIRAGAVVGAGDLTVTEVPSDPALDSLLVPGSGADAAVGQVATRSIAAGEPILPSDLRPAVEAGGRRAMSVPLSPANAVGGDLAVGDEVDVLVASGTGPRFVAEGLPVLAVPEAASGGLTAGSSGWWVVLGVEDRDALEIADGIERGTLYLLRSTGTPGLSVRELVVDAGGGGPVAEVAAGG